ncbi:MAG: uracil-DNA glycosylase [Candidatus Spechtbacterales bacterium]|nr:uracil-DNA glycosylase [Candidatus Spechtbacterales bacterium]
MQDKRSTELKKIKNEVANLRRSPIFKYREENGYLPVIGEGNHFAKVVFVGEAPGKNEAESGRPFVGSAGRVLNELLDSAGLERKKVYITNIVKDRPPSNRDPRPEELEVYAPFLDKQINIIKPKVIAGLGRFSSTYLMQRFGLADKVDTISKMHGKMFEVEANYGPIILVPLFHPAAALYSPDKKEPMKKDFKLIADILN